MFLKNVLKIALALNVLAASAWAAEPSCGIDALTRLTFAKIKSNDMRTFQLQKGQIHMGKISDAHLKDLWFRGIPHLKKLAAEQEISLVDLVSEFVTITELISEGIFADNPRAYSLSQANVASAIAALHRLGEMPADAKLKARHFQDLTYAYFLFFKLGSFATMVEEIYLEYPTFDSSKAVTPDYIDATFESFDKSSLDMAANLVDLINRRATFFSRAPENEIENVSSETQPTEKLNEPLSTEELPGTAPSSSKADHSLAAALVNPSTLTEGASYSAPNAKGGEYAVSLSRDLIKESTGRHAQAFARLMRTLTRGHRGNMGIKALFDLGPRIIEVKAVLSGHWRIFGCLDGSNLVLKKMIEIPANRSAYANWIPSNFCAD